MTGPVKKMYNEALRNREYNEEIKKADPQGYKKPNIWSDSLLKHLYGMAYYGWLVGKGQFDRSKYY